MNRSLCLLTVLAGIHGSVLAELRVPAFTAYIDPDPSGARVSEKRGITKWNDPDMKVSWFGDFTQTGDVKVQLELAADEGERVPLTLTVGEEVHKASIRGKGEGVSVVADFGTFALKEAGYHAFVLESRKPQGTLKTLVLDGAEIKDAHFNLLVRA